MSTSPSQDELRALANEALLGGIQSLGVEARLQGGAILCPGTPLQILCHEVMVSGEGAIVSLAIDLALGSTASDPVISECIAGFASDFDAALNSAVMNWMLSVFLTALAWHSEDSCPGHMASVHTRDFPGRDGRARTWRIISSPALAMGEVETSPDQMDTKETLMPLFMEITRTPQMHWVKAFVTNLPGGERNGDCTVDNVTSNQGKKLLYSSKTLPKPMMLRQFHILCPLEGGASEVVQPQARPSFWERLRGKRN